MNTPPLPGHHLPGLPPMMHHDHHFPERPSEVTMGCWVSGMALAFLSIDYFISLLSTSSPTMSSWAHWVSSSFMVIVVALFVVAGLLLAWSGYRWARTLLTMGAMVSLLWVSDGIFDADPRPMVGVSCALSGIIGSVLLCGGIWLLYRPESQHYFTPPPPHQ